MREARADLEGENPPIFSSSFFFFSGRQAAQGLQLRGRGHVLRGERRRHGDRPPHLHVVLHDVRGDRGASQVILDRSG